MQKLAAAVQLALLAALLAASYIDAAGLVRMQLTHVDAGRGLTQRELLQRMTLRSRARAARFLSASAPVTPGANPPGTEYLVHFAVGTPPQPVQLTLDTGSDLIWTQCRPCASCFHQALPYFDPSASSTFAGELTCSSPACQALPITSCPGAADTSPSPGGNQTCGYSYSYGDNSVTNGTLVADTFTFADAAGGNGSTTATVPALAFGCGHNNTGIFTSNETGIAGFGRGALSLPSQLRVHNFSYCFTNITAQTTPSPVLLGLPANLYAGAAAAVQTTPLVRSSSFYYLSLKGITVGSTRLPVPESVFALTANGTGGTIIDSGTSMTSLPQGVYDLLQDAFVAQVRLPMYNSSSVSNLCFAGAPLSSSSRTTKPGDVPKLLFHFEGATLDLPRENYMFEIQEAGRSLTCLAVNAGDDTTIIGNYQQQNMHVLYDLANDRLSFVPARCDEV